MARGTASHLLRIYSSKHSLFRVRVLFFQSNRCFNSNPPNSPNFPSPDPSTHQVINKLITHNPKYSLPNFDNQLYSTLVENGNNFPNSATVELDQNVEKIVQDEEKTGGCEHIGARDPVEIYRKFRDARRSEKQTRGDWDMLTEIFSSFSKSGWASNQALAVYIGASFFPTAAHKFRNFFFKKCQADVAKYLVGLGPGDAADRFLFPIFAEFCLEEFPDEIKRFRGMIDSADLTKPHTWFPFARAMKRKIIYHCGPTNSGKT